MLLKTLRILPGLAILGVAGLGCWQAYAYIPSHDDMPRHSFDANFSTNWITAVREALPASYSGNGNVDFNQATNALCQESQKGNRAAQALWGFALLVLKSSPEATATGLELVRGAAEKSYLSAILNLGYLFEDDKFVRKDY